MADELTKALATIARLPKPNKMSDIIVVYDQIINLCAKLSILDNDVLEHIRDRVITEIARSDPIDSRALRLFEAIICIYQED